MSDHCCVAAPDQAGQLSRMSIVNSYGLFQNMTTTRMEIVVEGSDDGKTGKP